MADGHTIEALREELASCQDTQEKLVGYLQAMQSGEGVVEIHFPRGGKRKINLDDRAYRSLVEQIVQGIQLDIVQAAQNTVEAAVALRKAEEGQR